jgi:tRNA(fMet)-specific endonuclease VapC
MSLYMLHTDIAADLIHGKSPALDSRIASTSPQELCISAVTRGELLCGLSQQWLRKKHAGPARTLEEVDRQFEITRDRIRSTERTQPLSRLVDEFLTRVPCLPWDSAAAGHFAMIAVTLHHSGTPIGNIDTMIAGHAMAADAVLVTNRETRFIRIAGLKLENWTAA